jgi:hypothetical protein
MLFQSCLSKPNLQNYPAGTGDRYNIVHVQYGYSIFDVEYPAGIACAFGCTSYTLPTGILPAYFVIIMQQHTTTTSHAGRQAGRERWAAASRRAGGGARRVESERVMVLWLKAVAEGVALNSPDLRQHKYTTASTPRSRSYYCSCGTNE